MAENQPKPPASDINIFAETTFRKRQVKFGIKEDDRRRHMYLIGKTGMGKSTLIENMIISDIQAGRGVGLVDPHGDLAEKVIKFIPNHRINDVIYINPADVQYPIAFNILENINPEHKNLIASGLVGVFKKIWADSWGPRLEYILINTILALLDYPGSTLLGVTRMLVDKKYRKKVVDKIEDPVVRMFWVDEYANYSEKFRTEAIAPIQNKVGQFLSSLVIRNIVGQSKSTIDMRQIMDQGKILILNLSKGRIGEENSALLGAMIVTKLQLAAMSRVDIPEPERRDFYLYVDEFQNFATDSFANILSEARKYRLDLILANQYLEQLPEETVKASVFGNVGTIVCFRVGSTDAEELEIEFGPTFMKEDLVNIEKYNFYLRLMIDGIASDPFSAKGLPPVTGENQNEEKVISVSRERYSRPRALVEEKISRWSGLESIVKGEEEKTTSGAANKPLPAVNRPPTQPAVRPPVAANRPGPQPPANNPLPKKTVNPIDDLKQKKISFVSAGSPPHSPEISLQAAVKMKPINFTSQPRIAGAPRPQPFRPANSPARVEPRTAPPPGQRRANRSGQNLQPGRPIKF